MYHYKAQKSLIDGAEGAKTIVDNLILSFKDS